MTDETKADEAAVAADKAKEQADEAKLAADQTAPEPEAAPAEEPFVQSEADKSKGMSFEQSQANAKAEEAATKERAAKAAAKK